MDTLCGVGLPELIVLALIGFVVIGPERSREVALTAGRWLRNLTTSAWWKDFNQVSRALRDLPNTLVRMAEIEEAQAELVGIQADLRRELDTISTGVGNLEGESLTPPTIQDVITDPWGIRNAAAETMITPRTVSSKENPSIPPDDSDAHER